MVRNKVIDIWDQRWSETTMGAQTKKFFQNVRQRIKIEKQLVYDSVQSNTYWTRRPQRIPMPIRTSK
jgi:hypothetical protein